MWPNCKAISGSPTRVLRTGSTVGRLVLNTASKRVSPPSTCSTYTMSALSIPRWGRPAAVSSILAATTELFDGASPVSGLISGPAGVELADDGAAGVVVCVAWWLLVHAASATTHAAPAAIRTAIMTGRQVTLRTWLTPHRPVSGSREPLGRARP